MCCNSSACWLLVLSVGLCPRARATNSWTPLSAVADHGDQGVVQRLRPADTIAAGAALPSYVAPAAAQPRRALPPPAARPTLPSTKVLSAGALGNATFVDEDPQRSQVGGTLTWSFAVGVGPAQTLCWAVYLAEDVLGTGKVLVGEVPVGSTELNIPLGTPSGTRSFLLIYGKNPHGLSAAVGVVPFSDLDGSAPARALDAASTTTTTTTATATATGSYLITNVQFTDTNDEAFQIGGSVVTWTPPEDTSPVKNYWVWIAADEQGTAQAHLWDEDEAGEIHKFVPVGTNKMTIYQPTDRKTTNASLPANWLLVYWQGHDEGYFQPIEDAAKLPLYDLGDSAPSKVDLVLNESKMQRDETFQLSGTLQWTVPLGSDSGFAAHFSVYMAPDTSGIGLEHLGDAPVGRNALELPSDLGCGAGWLAIYARNPVGQAANPEWFELETCITTTPTTTTTSTASTSTLTTTSVTSSTTTTSTTTTSTTDTSTTTTSLTTTSTTTASLTTTSSSTTTTSTSATTSTTTSMSTTTTSTSTTSTTMTPTTTTATATTSTTTTSTATTTTWTGSATTSTTLTTTGTTITGTTATISTTTTSFTVTTTTLSSTTTSVSTSTWTTTTGSNTTTVSTTTPTTTTSTSGSSTTTWTGTTTSRTLTNTTTVTRTFTMTTVSITSSTLTTASSTTSTTSTNTTTSTSSSSTVTTATTMTNTTTSTTTTTVTNTTWTLTATTSTVTTLTRTTATATTSSLTTTTASSTTASTMTTSLTTTTGTTATATTSVTSSTSATSTTATSATTTASTVTSATATLTTSTSSTFTSSSSSSSSTTTITSTTTDSTTSTASTTSASTTSWTTATTTTRTLTSSSSTTTSVTSSSSTSSTTTASTSTFSTEISTSSTGTSVTLSTTTTWDPGLCVPFAELCHERMPNGDTCVEACEGNLVALNNLTCTYDTEGAGHMPGLPDGCANPGSDTVSETYVWGILVVGIKAPINALTEGDFRRALAAATGAEAAAVFRCNVVELPGAPPQRLLQWSPPKWLPSQPRRQLQGFGSAGAFERHLKLDYILLATAEGPGAERLQERAKAISGSSTEEHKLFKKELEGQGSLEVLSLQELHPPLVLEHRRATTPGTADAAVPLDGNNSQAWIMAAAGLSGAVVGGACCGLAVFLYLRRARKARKTFKEEENVQFEGQEFNKVVPSLAEPEEEGQPEPAPEPPHPPTPVVGGLKRESTFSNKKVRFSGVEFAPDCTSTILWECPEPMRMSPVPILGLGSLPTRGRARALSRQEVGNLGAAEHNGPVCDLLPDDPQALRPWTTPSPAPMAVSEGEWQHWKEDLESNEVPLVVKASPVPRCCIQPPLEQKGPVPVSRACTAELEGMDLLLEDEEEEEEGLGCHEPKDSMLQEEQADSLAFGGLSPTRSREKRQQARLFGRATSLLWPPTSAGARG